MIDQGLSLLNHDRPRCYRRRYLPLLTVNPVLALLTPGLVNAACRFAPAGAREKRAEKLFEVAVEVGVEAAASWFTKVHRGLLERLCVRPYIGGVPDTMKIWNERIWAMETDPVILLPHRVRQRPVLAPGPAALPSSRQELTGGC